jgi:aflatoxin B1 aldehyde reductase
LFSIRSPDALQLIRDACDKENISMVEASFRWLLRHSALQSGTDGLLLGASSLTQMEENCRACLAAANKGPLPDNVLTAMDEAWEITKPSAFPYWRSYSADFPNRENLDPGASYTVKK